MSPSELFVGVLSKFDAVDWKARNLPFDDKAGEPLPPSACTPPGPTETRVVVPVWRSRRKMSEESLVSLGTRFVVLDMNATYRPSAEIDAGPKLSEPNNGPPPVGTEAMSVVPPCMSCTKTS